MQKSVSILVVCLYLLLILKFSFSTATQIELSLLSHKQSLLPQKNIATINDFLIYPNPHAFKYLILPFLNSKTFMQTYEHFKILHPKLEICKLLDNCETSTVLDFKETKTLYYINQNTPSPLNIILYSETSKTAIIAKKVSSEIKPNETCALLRSNEIFPFKEKKLLSQEFVWVARNLNNFFVTLKTNDNKFTPVARGILYEMNFDKDLECILNIHYLNRFEKFIITVRYFFTIPFLKYFEYISPLLGKCFNKLKDYTLCDFRTMNVNNCLQLIFSRILWLMFCHIHASLEFHIFTSPFYAMAYYISNILSSVQPSAAFICLIPLFFIGVCDRIVWPRKVIFDLLAEAIENDFNGTFFVAKDSESFLIFDIEPKNTMWALSFIVKRPKSNFTVLFFIAFLTSILLKVWLPNWYWLH